MEFLAVDFFGAYPDDPDAGELCLSAHLVALAQAEARALLVDKAGDKDGDKTDASERDGCGAPLLQDWLTPVNLDSSSLVSLRPVACWRRLQGFLDLFVAAGSPKQLVKQDLLLQIFIRYHQHLSSVFNIFFNASYSAACIPAGSWPSPSHPFRREHFLVCATTASRTCPRTTSSSHNYFLSQNRS